MEGDYLAPKPTESELPKFEEALPAPEFTEEASHETHQAKPALAGLVASETLKNNPNPEVRRMATEERMDLDPELLLKQVKEAADQDIALEGKFEHSHERKDDPAATQYDNSAAAGRAPINVPNEPFVKITPVPEEDPKMTPSGNTAQEYQDFYAKGQPVSLYKQAVVVGVTTAVAILAIFTTIKLT